MYFLKFLLEHTIESMDINQLLKYKNTVLHIASQKGFQQSVEILLQYGADIDVFNDDSQTPLHLACNYGHLQ